MAERYTSQAKEAIKYAETAAKELSQNYVGTEHLLLGLVQEGSGVAAKILEKNGITEEKILNLIDQLIVSNYNVAIESRQNYSPLAIGVLQNAYREATRYKSALIGTEHILIAIIKDSACIAHKLLLTMNINIQKLYMEILSAMGEETERKENYEKTSNKSNSLATPTLDKYSRDLTEFARIGKLDPVIGRDNETNRVMQILSRRTKNNPVLIGEPGVGKTAVVEGLAQKIADNKVPEFLKGKRLFQLDLTAMIAGTKYRGQFEERLQKVLSVAKKHQEVILFIDELHLLVGAGSAEGSMDAANVLKPALARGEVRLIGATTFDEYRKHIEKDAALSRRFQAVTVAEPSPEEAVAMLKGLSGNLAKHHQVQISDEILAEAVDLSQRYVTERFLPDKAIDVIDEAASLLKSSLPAKLSRKDKLSHRIKQLAGKIDAAVEAEDYQQAAEFKMQMRQLEQQAGKLTDEAEARPSLTDEYLRRAISAMTNIPVDRLSLNQMKDLLQLEKRLSQGVLGQGEAIEQLARSIRRNKAGLNRQNGPLGSFIFLGPTGVGKTELARVLAREVFGGDNSLIKIDMSEFSERHTASRLIGAPAGYVGYDDGGKLTDKVRRQPYSVVLFDEIEKAHPDVLNLLLQILEDGKLSDSHGRTVSFCQTIVILTSNVGAEQMVQDSELGFASSSQQKSSSQDRHERNSRAALRELEDFLRPELIGRFDGVITFKPLTRSVVRKIFDNLTADLIEAVKRRGMDLNITPAVKRWLIKQGFDEQRGVRVLRRTIQAELADPLSDVLLSNKAKPGKILETKIDNNKVVIDVKRT